MILISRTCFRIYTPKGWLKINFPELQTRQNNVIRSDARSIVNAMRAPERIIFIYYLRIRFKPRQPSSGSNYFFKPQTFKLWKQ